MTELRTIPDLVRHAAARCGDSVALEDARDGREVTYAGLWARVEADASTLHAAGFARGDRIALPAAGSIDWIVRFLAALHADLVVVLGADGELARRPLDTSCGANIVACTSGSTAAPRMVALTHHNLLANIAALATIRRPGDAECLLSVLPPSHLFELTAGQLAPLALGARIVYAGPPLPNRLLDAMRDRRVTRMLAVPALVDAMARSAIADLIEAGLVDETCRHESVTRLANGWRALPERRRDGIASAVRARIGPAFRSIAVGGAALAPGWVDLLLAVGVHVDVGYGLTEAGPLVSVGDAGACPRGSVGRPLPGVGVRIDGNGEILVRGASVTPGYVSAAPDSALAIEDGWLRTGDLGRLDEQGFLFITGRIKEAMVSATGETIYPDEIEPHYASPLFAECCVVPVRDADGNEIPTLVAVPSGPLDRAGFDREVAALRAAAPARCRIGGAILRDLPLPRTPLGKIQRRAIAEAMAAPVEAAS